jgi:FAD/FMN-containing dehydrogenase
MSDDAGVLKIVPEMVIYPRSTNDIRKVCRFAWQLAEKGHVIPVTVRGAGTDSTGAAIGKGASVVTTAHMNKIFEYDAKQKLVRLQPGVSIGALSQALSLYGTSIMSLAGSHAFGTIGGAIASAVAGPLAGKYGTIERAIDQLEVVLANGDVIQTGRINKRELSRRKGLQTFEGDIYRGIDGIIEESADILDNLRSNDATGYNTIADVKQKDGSFDLTPLFIGSQGTLGIITEMILRAEYRSLHYGVAALVFASANTARDALDDLCKMTPAFVEYFDAEFFNTAATCGRRYNFYTSSWR